jgi:hypothetical protein
MKKYYQSFYTSSSKFHTSNSWGSAENGHELDTTFFRNTVQTQILIHVRAPTAMNTHAHSTPMSTSERLSWFDLDIHEVGHQECLTVNGDVASH